MHLALSENYDPLTRNLISQYICCEVYVELWILHDENCVIHLIHYDGTLTDNIPNTLTTHHDETTYGGKRYTAAIGTEILMTELPLSLSHSLLDECGRERGGECVPPETKT